MVPRLLSELLKLDLYEISGTLGFQEQLEAEKCS